MTPGLQSFCAWVTLMVFFTVITAPVLPRGSLTTARSLVALAVLAGLATGPLALTLYMHLVRWGHL